MNEHTPSIELATLDDVGELARLRWELYAGQEVIVNETPDAYRRRFTDFARSAMASDMWRSWVARDGDRLVAAIWLQTVPRVPVPGKNAGPIGYLTNVYVGPEHRNAGLGAEMLDRVKSWCSEQGYSLVIVWPTERSRTFYRRGGFERLDEPLVLELGPDSPLER